MPDTPSIRPSCVLAAFLEQVADGRRVIVFGDASSRLSEHLLDRGARLVHVCDPDTSRVASAAARNTSQSVSYAPLSSTGLSVREGAFDLGIVENLAALASLGSELVLRQLSRALAQSGVAVIASPNPEVGTRLVGRIQESETIDYYELFDLVSAQFDGVRMFGQMPFLGYSVAAFGAQGEVEPALDTGFLPGGAEEPEWFLALAGSRADVLEQFQIVQLPAETLARGARAALHRDLQTARAAESAAQERLAEEEAECARLREVVAAGQRNRQKVQEVDEIRRQLAERDVWIAELEARAATADARADEVQTELDETLAALGRLGTAAGTSSGEPASESSLPSEVDESGQRLIDELERSIESTHDRIRKLEHTVGVAEEHSLALGAALETSRKRCADMEAASAAEKEASVLLTQELESLRAERLGLAERERELMARIREFEDDSGESAAQELRALEDMLAERGQHVRALERDLKESERVAQDLLIELDQMRRVPQDQPDDSGWSAAAVSPPTDAWASATQQTGADATTRVDQQLERQELGPQCDAMEEPAATAGGTAALASEASLDPGREAELVAELQMARWAVDKLQAELAAAKLVVARGEEVERELGRARAELLRQAAIIEELRTSTG